MAKRYVIRAKTPKDADGSLEFVIDENTLESDSGSPGSDPTSGPPIKVVSPAIIVSQPTEAVGPAGSPSSPDVVIYPTNRSTTAQPDITYRSPSAGITMVWSEPVKGFNGNPSMDMDGNIQENDIRTEVSSNIDRATAKISNFRGSDALYSAVVNFPKNGSGVVLVTIPVNVAEAKEDPPMRMGPPIPRTLSLSFDFTPGPPPPNYPTVSIQPPAGNPYVGRGEELKFAWNVPISTSRAAQADMLLDAFTLDDVVFNGAPAITDSMVSDSTVTSFSGTGTEWTLVLCSDPTTTPLTAAIINSRMSGNPVTDVRQGKWEITLATAVDDLIPSEINVVNNTVTAVTGSGTDWIITLETPVDPSPSPTITVDNNTVNGVNGVDTEWVLTLLENATSELPVINANNEPIEKIEGSGTTWTITLENTVTNLSTMNVTVRGNTVTAVAAVSGQPKQWTITVMNSISSILIGMTNLTPSSGSQVWTSNMTLSDVTSATTFNINVKQNSVTSQEGLRGPGRTAFREFTYNTPADPLPTDIVPSGTTQICALEFEVGDDDDPATDWLEPKFGAFFGVTDLMKIGDNLFGVAQIRRPHPSRDNELSDTFQASAAIFQVGTDGTPCRPIHKYPRILEAARSLIEHPSTANATQPNLYAFEGSHYLYQVGVSTESPLNNPRVGNLIRFSNFNADPPCISDMGKVWRIALGRQNGNTFEEYYGVAGGTVSPMLSDGSKIWALPGVGDLTFVSYNANRRYVYFRSRSEPPAPDGLTYNPDTNSIENLGEWQVTKPPDDENFLGLFEENIYIQEIELDTRHMPPRVRLVGGVKEIADDFIDPLAGLPYGLPTAATGDTISAVMDNWGLLTYSKTIERRLEFIPTNENTTWTMLLELARLTNCILHFHQDMVFFKPRTPLRAELTADFATDTSPPIMFNNATREFPSSGTIIIGDEIISYGSTPNDGELSHPLTRGLNHTTVDDHADGDNIFYVDHVLSADVFVTPFEDLTMDSDATNIYNVIEVIYDSGERTHTERDQTSIDMYGEHIFTINAPFLSNHQNAWARWSAQNALASFKDLQYLIRLNLNPTFDIEVGDYVYLNIPRDDIRRIGLVIQVIYNSESNVTEVDVRTISTS